MFHIFEDSLERSHDAEDLPFWEPTYRTYFGELFQVMVNHRRDGDHQRKGVDRSVILTTGKQFKIDEKVRWKPYDDIFLEYWSDEKERIPGWVCKELDADFIAYANAVLGVCYFLPVVPLQRAWSTCGQDWIKRFKSYSIPNVKPHTNRKWTTVGVPIPVEILLGQMLIAGRVTFEPLRR